MTAFDSRVPAKKGCRKCPAATFFGAGPRREFHRGQALKSPLGVQGRTSPPIPRPLPSPNSGREGEKFFLGAICGAGAPQIAPKPKVSDHVRRVRVFCGAKAPQNTRNFFLPSPILRWQNRGGVGGGGLRLSTHELPEERGERKIVVFLAPNGAKKNHRTYPPPGIRRIINAYGPERAYASHACIC
jgi:hypothetical protein